MESCHLSFQLTRGRVYEKWTLESARGYTILSRGAFHVGVVSCLHSSYKPQRFRPWESERVRRWRLGFRSACSYWLSPSLSWFCLRRGSSPRRRKLRSLYLRWRILTSLTLSVSTTSSSSSSTLHGNSALVHVSILGFLSFWSFECDELCQILILNVFVHLFI